MSRMFATCDPTDVVVNADNTLSCLSGWELREVMFPMYELAPPDLALIMGATLAFLSACYASRMIVRTIFSAGNSD